MARHYQRTLTAFAAVLGVITSLLASASVSAQPAQADAASLTAVARTSLDQFRDARRPIELTLSRALNSDDGEVVVLAGTFDMSALAAVNGTTLTITPGAFAFPAGESQLSVMLKRGGKWNSVTSLPLKILGAAGFVKQSIVPSIDVGSTGQVADGHSSNLQSPSAPHRQDITLGMGLRSSHERTRLTIESQANVVGAGREEQALRFAQRGANAPLVDLSSYLLSMRMRAARLEAGHLSVGTNRHLVSAFSSRGLALSAGPSWAQFSVGSVAGAPIVGWDNVIGLGDTHHRINTASLGLEFIPKRPGAVQLRFSALDGSLLPRPGFTQGAVVDAEESRGAGVELTASTPGQRARLSAGYTRSAFENPAARDTELTGGLVLRKNEKDRRGARYVESSLTLLQGTKLFKRLTTQLTLGVRHERVDPLFRSVGVSSQADREQNALDVNGSVGAVAINGGVTRGRDNLAAVSSLLTSRTDGYTTNASFGVAPLLRIKNHVQLLPQVTVAFANMHQYADGVPGSKDFRPKDLADQLNTAFDVAAQWQVREWRAVVRGNRTRTDNRQLERERADFSGSNVNASLGRAFGTRLDAGVDGSLEQQRNEELAQVNRVRRIGTNITWRATSLTALTTNITAARTRTPPATHDVTNLEMRAELAQSVRLFGKGPQARLGQGFLRFARSAVTLLPFDADGNALPLATQVQWTLHTGLSLRLW